MTFQFRKAKREDVGLLLAVSGGTGSGKTYSALRLAVGLAQGGKIAGIDTEHGRMSMYADAVEFDHGMLEPPYRPSTYSDAIDAAVKGGYKVVIVDSASHEHAGDGGLLDWHDEELERMGNKPQANMAAWIKPKAAHKKMVSKLVSLPSGVHLILCFRAEPKVEMRKEGGRLVVVPKESPAGLDGWIPICEKSLPFEATASFLLTADAPGVPKPIKLPEAASFPKVDKAKPMDEDLGRRIAEWASGKKAATKTAKKNPAEKAAPSFTITPTQIADLEAMISEVGANYPKFLKFLGVERLRDLPEDRMAEAVEALAKKRDSK